MSLITSEHPTFHGREHYESETYQQAPPVIHVPEAPFLIAGNYAGGAWIGAQPELEWAPYGLLAPEYIRRDIYEHQSAMLAEALATVATLQNKLKEVGHVHD